VTPDLAILIVVPAAFGLAFLLSFLAARRGPKETYRWPK
jgi:hypothetical protein